MAPSPIQRAVILSTVSCAVIVVGAMSIFAKPIWEASGSKNAAEWLGFTGNLIAAIVTLTAAYIAWKAVQLQIRIGVIERRADRLERELPGLHEAAWFLERIDLPTGMEKQDAAFWSSCIIELFQNYNIGSTETQYVREAEALLPSTNDSLRRSIAFSLFQIKSAAEDVSLCDTRIERMEIDLAEDTLTARHKGQKIKLLLNFQQRLDTSTELLFRSCDAFRELFSDVQEQVDSSKAQLKSCREEIDRFYTDK